MTRSAAVAWRVPVPTLEETGTILGCGCGRLTRRLAATGAKVRGLDFDGEAVGWCRDKRRFASFRQNGLEPPQPFPDCDVDLVYRVLGPHAPALPTQHGARVAKGNPDQDLFLFRRPA